MIEIKAKICFWMSLDANPNKIIFFDLLKKSNSHSFFFLHENKEILASAIVVLFTLRARTSATMWQFSWKFT